MPNATTPAAVRIRTRVQERNLVSAFNRHFDVVDDKGRRLGVWVTIERKLYVEVTPEWAADYPNSVYRAAPGESFEARVQQTRNGKSYGATQSGWAFRTLEQAEQYVAKAVAKREREYAKRFA